MIDYRLFPNIKCNDLEYTTNTEKSICPLEQLYNELMLKANGEKCFVWLEATGSMGKTTSAIILKNYCLKNGQACHLFELKDLNWDSTAANGSQKQYHHFICEIESCASDDLVIFDGYDEIDENINIKHALNCIKKASLKCHVIVASRPVAFFPTFDNVNIIHAYILPFSDIQLKSIVGQTWDNVAIRNELLKLLRNTLYLKLFISLSTFATDNVNWETITDETDLLYQFCRQAIENKKSYTKNDIDSIIVSNGKCYFKREIGLSFQEVPFDFGFTSTKIENYCIAFYLIDCLEIEWAKNITPFDLLNIHFSNNNSEALFFAGKMLQKGYAHLYSEKIHQLVNNKRLKFTSQNCTARIFNNMMTIILGYDRGVLEGENVRYLLGSYSKNKIKLLANTIQYRKYQKTTKKVLEWQHIQQYFWMDGDDAFIWQQYIQEIIIPKNNIEISKYAFCSCYNLVNVFVEATTEKWMKSNRGIMFRNICTVHCSDGDVLCIGELPTEMKELTIGENVKIVDVEILKNNLEHIKIFNNNRFSVAGDCLIENSTKTLLLGCKNSIISKDNTIERIGKNAFFRCNLLCTDITIPDGVNSIEENAFRESNITKIDIPSSVEKISLFAFECSLDLMDVYYNGTKLDWHSKFGGVCIVKEAKIHYNGIISKTHIIKMLIETLLYIIGSLPIIGICLLLANLLLAYGMKEKTIKVGFCVFVILSLSVYSTALRKLLNFIATRKVRK